MKAVKIDNLISSSLRHTMLQRLYANNFRCLENFELKLKQLPSALLIGKNGVGKSTVAAALSLLQAIGRGESRVRGLIEESDITSGRQNVPVRFEIEAILDEAVYKYELAFDLPPKFRELRILEEKLTVGNEAVFSRSGDQVKLHRTNQQVTFALDWHMVALPIIQAQDPTDPSLRLKTWLANMMILAPIPSLMSGESSGEDSFSPKRDVSNYAQWFSSVLSQYPAAYGTMTQYLQQIMPDFQAIKNTLVGKDARSIQVLFGTPTTKLELAFGNLSDGEKCFFLCALVLAANEHYGPLFCFWDEPDNYLALSEVEHFVVALRRAVLNKGQLLVTSHNPLAIKKFSAENTFLLGRKSHLEPTQIRPLVELALEDDLVEALIRDDVTL